MESAEDSYQIYLKGLQGNTIVCRVVPSTLVFCTNCSRGQSFWNEHSGLIQSVKEFLSCDYLQAEYVVKEYLRFLELKCCIDDFKCSKLSPSPLIDKVWQVHMADSLSYKHTCKHLYEKHHIASDHFHFFHRIPGKNRRLRQTKLLYQVRFSALPQEVYWSESIDLSTFQSADQTAVTCCVGDYIARREGASVGDCRLIFKGNQLEAGLSLDFYGIHKEYTLYLTLRLRGC